MNLRNFASLLFLMACQSQKDNRLSDCHGDRAQVRLPDPVDSGALGLVSIEQATHIAVASGDWSDACVWDGGLVPDNSARVIIPEGISVEVDGIISRDLGTVGIYGKLSFAPDVNTELRVNTMVSAMRGVLEIGDESQPISKIKTARLVFTADSIFDSEEDPLQLSRGAILMGKTTMHGAAKSHRATLAVHPQAGDTKIYLTEPPSGWEIGDSVVIAGTEAGDPESDEQRVITGIQDAVIVFDEPLSWDHVAPESDLEVHVANLSRNILISSAHTDINRRGHLMFMHNLLVDTRYVRIEGLGRTNKRVQVDDWFFPELTSESAVPGPRTNIRGRYSIHFHQGGVDPLTVPARVEGCVVENDPGWAYVNHSSHVDFINNVSYDVVGGAFQTEAGDEQGSFVGNIAIRTVNPDYPIENPDTAPVDIREDSQDFAFQGDGFWIHGGGVRLEDNVATGSSGHGFIFWTEGIREIDTTFDEMNRFQVQHIPNGNLLEVDSVNAWWVPIKSFEGNRTYASNKGLAVYYVHTTLFEDIHDLTPAYLETVHSTFEDFHIWNVGIAGIHLENSTRFTFRNLRLINSGEGDAIGINTRSTVGDRTIWDNVTVKGFDTGMVVPTQGDITIRRGIWSNVTDFFVVPPQFEPGRQGDNRDLLISVDFEPHPMAGPNALNVKLAGAEALDGQLSMHNEEDAHRLILVPDRIVFESNIHERRRLYFKEQAPETIPINADIISSEAYGGYLDDIVGQSNQGLMNVLGLSFAGALLPNDVQAINGVQGGFGGPVTQEPLPIPACLFIDEAPPPADTFDSFDFYACWESQGGLTGTVAPFDHQLVQ